MDRNEIDFLSASVAMIEQADDVKMTAKRMIRMVDHMMHTELYRREHKPAKISRKWVECALKNLKEKTVCPGQTLEEFIGSNCFEDH